MTFPCAASRRFSLSLAPLLATFLALLASCGGGGSDAPKASWRLQTLLRDGDSLPGDFEIDTIESANLADEGTIALIASQPGTPKLNGVFLRAPGGEITPILTPGSAAAEGLSLTTVRNLQVSGTGEASFEVGGAIDDDALLLYSGGRLTILARTEPGTTPEGFRLLGEHRIADGGAVAFSHGVTPCTVDSSGERERVSCTVQIHEGDAGGLRQVDPQVRLEEKSPSSVAVVMNDGGRIALGLPAGGKQSLVGIVVDGEYQGRIARGEELAGLGAVLSAKPRAIAPDGDMAVDARFDTDDDGAIDLDRVILLRGTEATEVARTGVPAGTKEVIAVRSHAIDDAGRIVFSATFGDPGASAGLISLRIWDGTTTQEIAYEGQGFGEDDEGNDLKILEIKQIRVAGRGDVVFSAKVGFVEDGTQHIADTRILRWSDGGLDTLVKTGEKTAGGTIVELASFDVNDGGDLLLVAGVVSKANRNLLFLPRE